PRSADVVRNTVRRIGPTGQEHGAVAAYPSSFAESARRSEDGFSGVAMLLPVVSSCRQFRMCRSAPASAVIAGNDTPSVRLVRKSCRNGNRNVCARRERAWEGHRAELRVSGSRNGRTPFRSGGAVRFVSVPSADGTCGEAFLRAGGAIGRQDALP